MGLDQYAYVAAKAGQRDEYYEHYGEKNNPVAEPREIAYWRKHPNLQGWMNDLFIKRGGNESFNGVELELTWQDIDDLEVAVKERQLPATTGFFFGDNNDEYYEQRDLEFIKKARAELFCGLKVFYNSSW